MAFDISRIDRIRAVDKVDWSGPANQGDAPTSSIDRRKRVGHSVASGTTHDVQGAPRDRQFCKDRAVVSPL